MNFIHNIGSKTEKAFWYILALFIFWRIYLIIALLLAINYIPLGNKNNFLGGGIKNYQIAPEIFSWANFDGEHYLSISIYGYKFLEQAFFPIYPWLIFYLSQPLQSLIMTPNLEYNYFLILLSSTVSGIFISNAAILLSLVILWKLLRIDYKEKVCIWTIILLLLFPTSFFLGAVYSESLFLVLSLTSFYFARKGHWFWTAVFGILSSATRIFGILLLPAFILEIWQQKISFRKSFWVLFIPLGLIVYMIYQWQTVGDPLAFYRLQKLVGEQHQSGITLLPQVMYRYIKILFTTDINNPIYQTMVLEFLTGIIFFAAPIYGYFKKARLSYIFFALAGFLMPSIQGSLSSVPRYILVLFPSFLALSLLITTWPRYIKVILVCVLLSLLAIETMMFIRGYWIA